MTDAPATWQGIKIAHLLFHTAGVTDSLNRDYGSVGPSVLDQVAQVRAVLVAERGQLHAHERRKAHAVELVDSP